MTNDHQVKANLLKALMETLDRAKALVNGVDAMDRINDYDLLDQTYAMTEMLKDLEATVVRAQSVNG